jgi:hypothetical protein
MCFVLWNALKISNSCTATLPVIRLPRRRSDSRGIERDKTKKCEIRVGVALSCSPGAGPGKNGGPEEEKRRWASLAANILYAESLGLARAVDALPRRGLYIPPFLFSSVFFFSLFQLHVSGLCCISDVSPGPICVVHYIHILKMALVIRSFLVLFGCNSEIFCVRM